MDSIGDNVMAIICVVVGILIIGCALVPIVDNASVIETEVEVDEETSGYNTLKTSSTNAWVGPVSLITITADGSSISINGGAYEGTYLPDVRTSVTSTGRLAYANPSGYRITVLTAFDNTLESSIVLSPGTIVYDGATLTVSGTVYGSTEEYSHSADYSTIYAKAPTECFISDETQWYGLSDSPITIGEGQKCLSSDEQTVIETTTTETPAGITMTSNADHTATLTFGYGNWYGPYKWVGYTTETETTTSESEYAGLYNMIPVLCILGMAYVLIRRFY